MAKARLTPDEIESVVGLLTSWRGKLTWELLLERVEALLSRPFTRQGLDKQDAIRIAYQKTKERLRTAEDGTPRRTVDAEFLQRRIDALLAENEVLRSERERLYEKFAAWLYNARSRGITEAVLNMPLPAVDRDGSVRKK